ncbi:GNAT family acetyltransferase [Actinoplanes italicus]|uniref:Putative N-acetyltransferase YhbS n=1 Tax=Actinoplanes italicus TaxID=113567 RepID=A0A2T0KDQ2_9ACTN|nr:GNAT family N-acetyltransferase [Actinoplanes italicus]PRX21433.1 putative N-acetyltransferase YhbS [Actinoplanes italicus]GIE27113.1 GNAT family acetyltransferase [Actinoplanes italicus]
MQIRIANRTDVPAVLGLLADDDVSRARGFGVVPEEVDAAVWAAFESIDADDRNELIVAADGDDVIGTCQLTFIPGLSRGGAERMLIEAVRIHSGRRGQGLGGELIRWTIERARERGCRIVQLTTDKRRTDAHRFYAALGFEASHEGMKLML